MPLGCAYANASGVATLSHRLAPERQPKAVLKFLATVELSALVSNPVTHTVRTPGNVLVLIADDLGVDRLHIYNTDDPAGDYPTTLVLKTLAQQGLRFNRAYSAPTCSPTRAALQTGRQQWRTGVGKALSYEGKAYLRADETTLPEMLDERTDGAYSHVAIGKWHLGSNKLQGQSALEQGLDAEAGTDYYRNNPTTVHRWKAFAGTLIGVKDENDRGSYTNWTRYQGVRDTEMTDSPVENQYATTVHVNDAITYLDKFKAESDQPWLMYVAFNAPHAPYTCPPPDLVPLCTEGDAASEYNAMVEAMDKEIGRLLNHLDNTGMGDNTTVIFIGDNGTPQKIAGSGDESENFFKGTIYEGGIHVPFIVRSPMIPEGLSGLSRQTDAMVHAVDLFATVAEIAGVPLSAREIETRGLDSVSFVNTLIDPSVAVRDYVMAEGFQANGLHYVNPNRTRHQRAILRENWKLHIEYTDEKRTGEGPTWTERLYDLSGVKVEGAEVCSGSTPATAGGARGPAAADCAAQSAEIAAAYRELRSIERSIRAQIDPLHGHCGDESMNCPIPLPVRVMPQTMEAFRSRTYAVDRWFWLDEPAGGWADIRQLYIQGHGLGYRDGNTDAAGVLKKDGKVAVQLGACNWIDLTNSGPAVLYEPERHYGGIGGGFRTVRLTVPLAKMMINPEAPCVKTGFNRVQFRFNGTDGVSSGFRILDFNLQDASGAFILPPEAFVQDDPNDWTAPYPHEVAIENGKAYFMERRSLIESPRDPVMTNAACSDCHARDGRDLAYFAYSNESIINRAVFHGLSIEKAEMIASYIRSLDVPRHGRPWNPPYQPGAGIDTRPDAAARWAAGAGLDAVLDSEKPHAAEILDAMFPLGWTDSATIAAQLRGEGLAAGTINLRQIPTAIQMPGWNSWLPEKHPFDIWGEPYLICTINDCNCQRHDCPDMVKKMFDTFPAFPKAPTPENGYQDMRHALEAGLSEFPTFPKASPPENGYQDIRQTLEDSLSKLPEASDGWLRYGATEETVNGESVPKIPALDFAVQHRGFAIDFIKRNLKQWMAVKYWEVAQEFNLEQLGPQVYGENGEFLSWPFGHLHTVFAIVPHLTSNNDNNLEFPLHNEIGYQVANGLPLYCEEPCFKGSATPDICAERVGDITVILTDDTGMANPCNAVRACFNACEYPESHGAQTRLKGDYDSTAWYHLQMILSAGARNLEARANSGEDAVRPVDWPYALMHVYDVGHEAAQASPGANVWESLRYVATWAKTYQMRDNGKGPGITSWSLRDVGLHRLVGSRGYVVRDELWHRLASYLPDHPDLRVRLGNAFLHAFLDVMFPEEGDVHYTPELARKFDTWPHRDKLNSEGDWWKLDPHKVDDIDFVQPFKDARNASGTGPDDRCPKPIDGIGTGHSDGGATGQTQREFEVEPYHHHAENLYRTIPWLKNLGFDAELLSELGHWA